MASPSISLSKAEKSYIQSSLLSCPPFRSDGRSLHDFRAIRLETGLAPLANGSAKVAIGGRDGRGGTEVFAAVKLEVEDVEYGEDEVDGRIVCGVNCSPAAYPHLSSPALEDLSHDHSTLLHQTLSHPSLHPLNLAIIKGRKAWVCYLDIIVLSDNGNVSDAVFIGARAALWDTKVPRTRGVEYQVKRMTNMGAYVESGSGEGGGGDMDMDEDVKSGFDTRRVDGRSGAVDFELLDYWDEGEELGGREAWPVCITLNLVPPIHYLDATNEEEAATPLKLLLIFSFRNAGQDTDLQAMRVLGPGELHLTQVKNLVKDGEKYARELYGGLNAKLKDEDVRRNQKARKFGSRR